MPTCSTSTPASRWPTSRPCWPTAITLVQSVTDVPLSIDSSIIAALEAGLAVYQGKPLVNSVTGEEEVLERVMPLVAKYGAAVVAISNDETGISMDPDVRFAVAKRIVERAADFGIPANDVVVDPLVMPIGALGQAGQHAFQLDPPAARRAEGQHDLRRRQRQLRSAQPASGHRHVPGHGDRGRHDLGDHEPDAPRDQSGGDGCRRAGRPGQGLCRVDPRQPGPNRGVRTSERGAASPPQRVAPHAPNRLHPFRLDRRGRHRHHGVDCRAPAGRRSRFGVRRTRHLRTLPDRAVDGLVRQVGDRQRGHSAVGLVIGRSRLRDQGQRPPTSA